MIRTISGSSYPYCMLSEKYPCTKFKKIDIKKLSEISSEFCYIIRIKLYNVKDKYYNHIISQSKCNEIYNGRYDNGRVVSCDYLVITVTDIDLRHIVRFYSFDKYEIIEAYFSHKQYLPKKFYEFILEKYKDKTTLKGIPEKKLQYALAKNRFNSLYGMIVTNSVSPEISFINEEWSKRELTNYDIIVKLLDIKSNGFLNFPWRNIRDLFCEAEIC